MEPISIYYNFVFEDESEQLFHLQLHPQTLELLGNLPDELPSWTDLTLHQCPHCPLDAATSPQCPLAANLVNIVKHFNRFLPYQDIHLDVVTAERMISQETTVQAGLGSLLGLIMATSGCPHTAYFKPMARFHLPLASNEETMYRSISMYWLAQYFRHQTGREMDMELKGLEHIYEDVHTVNTFIAKRFLAASYKDSSVEAVVQLDVYAQTFLGILDEPLEEMRYLFEPFLSD
jgi:hypothetical protein